MAKPKSNLKEFEDKLVIENKSSIIVPNNTLGILPIVPRRVITNKHDDIIISILYGSLLGDCYGERQGRNARFCFDQCGAHQEYVYWLHRIFASRGYCNSNIPEIKTRKQTSKKTGLPFTRIRFSTYSFSDFNAIYDNFYHNKIKKVPLDISQYLDAPALAIWIQDDGTAYGKGLKICSDSFLLEEVELLCKVINDKFNLDTEPVKEGILKSGRFSYRVLIPSNKMDSLKNLILPYYHRYFLYKLGMTLNDLNRFNQPINLSSFDPTNVAPAA